jgi:RimJ/RimL family protein N-acetyltransferase
MGVVAIDGASDAIDPAWWIDRSFRQKGYWTRMIEALAPRLFVEGVTGVRSHIVIAAGPNDPASRRLVRLLRERLALLVAVHNTRR